MEALQDVPSFSQQDFMLFLAATKSMDVDGDRYLDIRHLLAASIEMHLSTETRGPVTDGLGLSKNPTNVYADYAPIPKRDVLFADSIRQLISPSGAFSLTTIVTRHTLST